MSLNYKLNFNVANQSINTSANTNYANEQKACDVLLVIKIDKMYKVLFDS